MNNVHPNASLSTPKPSSYKEWLIMPKLIFFFLGIIQCYGIHCYLIVIASDYWDVKEATPVKTVRRLGFIDVIGSLSFAFIADKSKKYRLVLVSCVLLFLIPSVTLIFRIFMSPEDYINRVIYFLFLSVLLKFFLAGTVPVVNAMIMNELAGEKDNFCFQRVFKSLANLFVVLLIKKWPILKYPSLHIGVLAISIVVSIILVYSFDAKIEHESETDSDSKPQQPQQPQQRFGSRARLAFSKKNSNSIWAMFSYIRFIFLIIGVSIAGFHHAYLNLNYYTFLEYLLGEGWRSFYEVIFYFDLVAEILTICLYKQLSQIIGTFWIWNAGHFLLIVRNLAYILIPSEPEFAYLIYLADSLKGISFGLLTMSIIHSASDLSKSDFAATSQSIFESAFSGFTTLIAYFLLSLNHVESPDFVENIKLTYTVSTILGAIIIVVIGITEIFSFRSSTKSRV